MTTKTFPIMTATAIALALFMTGCTQTEPLTPTPSAPVTQAPAETPTPTPTVDGELDDFVDEQNAGVVVPLDGTQTTVVFEGETFEVPAGATDVRFKKNTEGAWTTEFTFPVTDDELGDAINDAEQG
jgi:hypothetical protein